MGEAKRRKKRGFSPKKITIELSDFMASGEVPAISGHTNSKKDLLKLGIVDCGIAVAYSFDDGLIEMHGFGYPSIRNEKIFIGLATFSTRTNKIETEKTLRKVERKIIYAIVKKINDECLRIISD